VLCGEFGKELAMTGLSSVVEKGGDTFYSHYNLRKKKRGVTWLCTAERRLAFILAISESLREESRRGKGRT